jgi:RNA polymerase sigma-B factor
MTVTLDRKRLLHHETDRDAGAGMRTDERTIADEVGTLLARMAALRPGDPRREALRSDAIVGYLPMAGYLARRYRNRGEPLDDLVQVATVGLIKAIDGFDPARGTTFASYAVPTIVGELKRHFRDKGWGVRVPRRLQELCIDITNATGPLTQRLGRVPTVADLAAHLKVSEEEIIDGLESGHAYNTLSLDAPMVDDEAGTSLVDMLGGVDPEIAAVERREALRPMIAKLPERQQRIIAMRFFGNMTQSQIAEALGISQMHVSRLLAHALRQLREALLDDA